jgi:hypothetical protein
MLFLELVNQFHLPLQIVADRLSQKIRLSKAQQDKMYCFTNSFSNEYVTSSIFYVYYANCPVDASTMQSRFLY